VSPDTPKPPRFSLRTRLLLAVTITAFAGLLLADIATYAALRTFLIDRVDTSLETANRPILGLILDRPGRIASEDANTAALAAAAPGAYVEVRGPNNEVLLGEPTQGPYTTSMPDIPRELTGLDRSGDVRYFTVDAEDEGDADYRVRAVRVSGGTILVALPLDDVDSTLKRLVAIAAVVTGAALLAAFGLGLWLVRVGLRPLGDIEDTAAEIAGGDLTQRVPEDDRTEVGRLGASLNLMLGRIEEAFARRAQSEEQLRRFVADASHELRTPLAAVSAYAELFERGAQQRPDDLARVMRGIRVETARMQTLIDDLLLLARLDEGRPLASEPVDLVPLLEDAVDAARAVGPDWPITLDAPPVLTVTGDPMALRQVVDNLLANVRTHTPTGTSVRVSARITGTDAVLEVADDGPGLTPEDAARVFERFYRADPSRSRSRGGSGLGLAVVAALVGAHGGQVDVDSDAGAGATFRVRIPLTARPAEPPPATAAAPVTEAGPPESPDAVDTEPVATPATRSSDR
jgi:two-component system OmpR family sensor kinase